ncbi:hypothetical protein IWQ60_006122 [Tieghemiomyces parasiticus]|uniref:Uncharacterized protein n=1 Tax=Tieghemiomyces parasiticus TaxID=78921 RepID=A0A9W8A8N7_9FUNG|nr:hypothetical protein IWQ60_006122 [Tieghemiomyces parasiticus]
MILRSFLDHRVPIGPPPYAPRLVSRIADGIASVAPLTTVDLDRWLDVHIRPLVLHLVYRQQLVGDLQTYGLTPLGDVYLDGSQRAAAYYPPRPDHPTGDPAAGVVNVRPVRDTEAAAVYRSRFVPTLGQHAEYVGQKLAAFRPELRRINAAAQTLSYVEDSRLAARNPVAYAVATGQRTYLVLLDQLLRSGQFERELRARIPHWIPTHHLDMSGIMATILPADPAKLRLLSDDPAIINARHAHAIDVIMDFLPDITVHAVNIGLAARGHAMALLYYNAEVADGTYNQIDGHDRDSVASHLLAAAAQMSQWGLVNQYARQHLPAELRPLIRILGQLNWQRAATILTRWIDSLPAPDSDASEPDVTSSSPEGSETDAQGAEAPVVEVDEEFLLQMNDYFAFIDHRNQLVFTDFSSLPIEF